MELEDAGGGIRGIMCMPWKMSMRAGEVQRAAPWLEQDADGVRSEKAWLSRDEIEGLRRRDILT